MFNQNEDDTFFWPNLAQTIPLLWHTVKNYRRVCWFDAPSINNYTIKL